MDKNQAIRNFVASMPEYNVLSKPMTSEDKTYFKGKGPAAFIKWKNGKYDLVLVKDLEFDELKHTRQVLEELNGVDEWDQAYDNKKDMNPINFNQVYISNEHAIHDGKFYSFDEIINGRYFLTKNLNNLLSVVKNCGKVSKDVGYLFRDASRRLIQNSANKMEPKNDFDKNLIFDIHKWFKECNIDSYNTIDPENKSYNYHEPGILVGSNWIGHHFILVSDGSDSDLVRAYIKAREIQKKREFIYQDFNGSNQKLESIVIASPSSINGHLFNDDRMSIGDHEYYHEKSYDFMPEREFLKTFQFCRLPFALYEKGDMSCPINFLVSDVLNGNDKTPSMLYMKKKAEAEKPMHDYYVFPQKGFGGATLI
ncbi:hypothetical protein KY334_01940 [Candidatus Woesearchaeota archaeon]|nr:hypothetical protein [Candidatus Woesearchaeota archaeon]